MATVHAIDINRKPAWSRLATWLSLAIYSLAAGCSSVREVPMSNEIKSGDKVYSVTLLTGEFVEFDDDRGIINSYRGTIDGKDRHDRAVSVKLDDVKSVRMDKTDTTKSVAAAALVVGAGVAAVFALLARSMDFD